MRIKTIELKGEQLDHFVAIALKWEQRLWGAIPVWFQSDGEKRFRCQAREWQPSTTWMQGGPIIEKHCITVIRCDDDFGKDDKGFYNGERIPVWAADIGQQSALSLRDLDGLDAYWFEEKAVVYGPTPLVAAMRCFVFHKLGEEVEL